MSYRDAASIKVLCAALRTQRPGITLGTIRDPAGGSESDHNPWVKDSAGVGVVRAVDIMGMGADFDRLAANLGAKLNKHPAMGHGAYVIHNQHIISADRLGEGWRAMEDRGSPTANHFDHVHCSVALAQGGYDYKGSWGALFSGSGTGAAATPGDPPAHATSNTPTGQTVPVSATAAHHQHGGHGQHGGTAAAAAAASSSASDGLGVDGVKSLVAVGAALSLGVALVALGALRLVKPTTDAIQDDVRGAATAVIPEARAAGAVAGAAKTGAS